MADKPKKFIKGHNVLKAKSVGGPKQLSKAKELEKKKAEEAETAAVLNEYIADFTTGAALGKTFVRAGVYNPEKSNKPFLPGQDDDEEEAKALYKPKSKMQELAEEFKKSKVITEEYKSSKDPKKKVGEKKKSNLELFKEELERSQQERDIRRKLKKGDLSGISEEMLNSLPPTFFNQPKGMEEEFGYQYESVGSHDTGDPSTTNLFISNINPKMNEEQLCKVFGRYGPLASVKIMWPRTEEEKARNRNCGFVAFMTRKDGEKALDDIEGKYVMDYEMKIGWGKAVPTPPLPIYVHPSQSQALRPPKQSGLPFNCQLPYKIRKAGITFNGNLENTVVKVVIPTERPIVSLINRVVEFVVREGPMFEAMIMNREIANPLFRFLFDNKSNEHIYYRWRVFSLLQGDTTNKWSQGCFRMFINGSIWQPPTINPYGNQAIGAGMTASAAIACVSNSNAHGGISSVLPNADVAAASSPTLAMKKNFLLEQLLKESNSAEPQKEEKKNLSDRQRDRLEDLLRTVTTDRIKIGELMLWCIDHADCSEEIVECICESLSILETPIPTKVARLFLVSDILHNSGSKVHNASKFRKAFQNELLETMENLHKALKTCSTKTQTEKFRKQVLTCLAAWQDWSVYPPAFLIQLQNVFVGISTPTNIKLEEELANKESLLAKLAAAENPEEVDDVDGVPLAVPEEDVDGIAMEDADIDGIPLTKDHVDEVDSSRWTKKRSRIGSDDPLSKSRWEKVSDDEDNDVKEKEKELPAGKWAKVEGVKTGKNSKKEEESEEEEEEDEEKEKEKKHSKSPERVVPSKRRRSDTPPPEDDEGRRKFLRDVEVKVMRFVDKLEQRGGSRSGLNINKEAAKFRQQLIEEYEMTRVREHKRRVKSERKRERSFTPPPETKRRKSSKKRSPSLSSSDSESDDRYKSNRKKGGRSPNYSPAPRSRSPRGRSLRRSSSPQRSPIFSDRSKSPFTNRSPPRREYARHSPSLSPSPRRSLSPSNQSPRRYKHSPSPRYSPPTFSPRRLASSITKTSKKKKAKKSKR